MKQHHHHVFDTDMAYVNEEGFQAFMCRCSQWGTRAGGEWRIIPRELLPSVCRLGTWLHKAERVARVIAISTAVLALLYVVWG